MRSGTTNDSAPIMNLMLITKKEGKKHKYNLFANNVILFGRCQKNLSLLLVIG